MNSSDLKNNKELLYDLYVNKGMSLSQIGVMVSEASATVRSWLIKSGIKTRISTVDVYKELKQTDFSPQQKYLIVGSVLGDGSITIGKDCINARFVERHSEDQKGYLEWKRNCLRPFTKSNVYKKDGGNHCISGVDCLVKDSYIFSTMSHPYLTSMYNLFYKKGIKIIPEDLKSLINYLSIAVWVCDDGCLTYNRASGIYRLDLHTESFTYKENVILCKLLSEMFGFAFRINSRHYKSGEAFYICLSGEYKLKDIVSKIKPFIPDCMFHKFKNYIV